jgi:hypothetical protein
MSCVPPDAYKQRFMQFMNTVFVKKKQELKTVSNEDDN